MSGTGKSDEERLFERLAESQGALKLCYQIGIKEKSEPLGEIIDANEELLSALREARQQTSFGVEIPPTMELQPNDDLYCFGSATAYLSFKATIAALEKGQIDFAWIRDWIERCLASCGRLPNGHNVGFQKAVEALGKREPLTSSLPQTPADTSVSHKKQSSVGQPKEQQQKIFYGKDSATIDRQVWKFMRQLKTVDWTETDWYDFYRLLTDAFTQIAKRHLAHNASLGDEQKEQKDL